MSSTREVTNKAVAHPLKLWGLAGCAILALAMGGCATQDESHTTVREQGGTIPWNRPEKWEGPGVLGSQMSQMQGM